MSLRSPFGETVVRDIVGGRWAEPVNGDADLIGASMWALPGLVDAHSHLASSTLDYGQGDLDGGMTRARQALNAGVTLVLDKGWTDSTTICIIESVPENERPDIEAAERILAVEDGYYPDFALEIDPDQIETHVETAAALGRGWVKLVGDWPRRDVGPVANFTEDQLRRAVETAERSGARVAIHTMARDAPSAAVAAGVHSIEHGLFMNSDDVATLASRRGSWVPTVLRMEAIVAQLGAESSGGRLLLEGLDNIQPLLPMAIEAGVHVLAGTDLVDSAAAVADEALRLWEFGLSPHQALETVSVSGFAASDRDPHFGVGTSADAVLFSGNPLEELEVLRHPAIVIRQGIVR